MKFKGLTLSAKQVAKKLLRDCLEKGMPEIEGEVKALTAKQQEAVNKQLEAIKVRVGKIVKE